MSDQRGDPDTEVEGADSSLVPSSTKWNEAVQRHASRRMTVSYAGGLVTIYEGCRYFVYAEESVLIGWHGTFDPPCDMGGEPLIQIGNVTDEGPVEARLANATNASHQAANPDPSKQRWEPRKCPHCQGTRHSPGDADSWFCLECSREFPTQAYKCRVKECWEWAYTGKYCREHSGFDQSK